MAHEEDGGRESHREDNIQTQSTGRTRTFVGKAPHGMGASTGRRRRVQAPPGLRGARLGCSCPPTQL